jgi:hypothetical protein
LGANRLIIGFNVDDQELTEETFREVVDSLYALLHAPGAKIDICIPRNEPRHGWLLDKNSNVRATFELEDMDAKREAERRKQEAFDHLLRGR